MRKKKVFIFLGSLIFMFAITMFFAPVLKAEGQQETLNPENVVTETKSALEWFKSLSLGDLQAIGGGILGFLSAQFITIIAFAIKLVKQRAKNFNTEQALRTLKIQIDDEQKKKLDAMQKEFIVHLDELSNCIVNGVISENEAQKKKIIEAQNQMTKALEESKKEIEEATYSDNEIANELVK